MIRVFSILGTALGNLVRPRSHLAKAIAGLILFKLAVIVAARLFWFGPMIHAVVPGEVADRLVAPAASADAGDVKGDHP